MSFTLVFKVFMMDLIIWWNFDEYNKQCCYATKLIIVLLVLIFLTKNKESEKANNKLCFIFQMIWYGDSLSLMFQKWSDDKVIVPSQKWTLMLSRKMPSPQPPSGSLTLINQKQKYSIYRCAGIFTKTHRLYDNQPSALMRCPLHKQKDSKAHWLFSLNEWIY